MIKIIILAFIFIANISLAQSKVVDSKVKNDNYNVEHCTETLGIATKNNLSALWNFKTQSLISNMDSSLYQYYPELKVLLIATILDSIHCYDMSFENPKFLFVTYQKVLLDIFDKHQFYHEGILYNLGAEAQFQPEMSSLIAIIGIELLDESAIILDRKFRGDQSIIPLRDEFGNDILYFDSISGDEFYMYENRTKGYSKGGVRDRLTKEWIIEPSANWIIKGYSTYFTEKTVFIDDTNTGSDKILYNIYDFQGKVIEQNLTEFQILNEIKNHKYLVPKYECDSGFFISELESLFFGHYYSFISHGKTGLFQITTNNIIHEPVDFMEWSKPFNIDVRTVIDKDTITFYIKDIIQKYGINEASKFEFYYIINGANSFAFRSYTNSSDSLYIYYYKYSNIIDSISKQSNNYEYLISVLDPNKRKDSLKTDQLLAYGIEIIGNNQIIVTNHNYNYNVSINEPKSGVFDLKQHVWIVKPKYYSVIKIESGFKAFFIEPEKSATTFDLYDLSGNILVQ